MLLRDVVVTSRLSGDSEVALDFLGNLVSNSSKMSELRDNRLDNFLVTPIVLSASVDDALLVDCCCDNTFCSKLSNVFSATVSGIDDELGTVTLDIVDVTRRGGRRFFGRTEIR